MIYLNCHTWFSLRYGTFSEEDLCILAQNHGAETVAVTDINSSTACLKFCKIAPSYGIKPLVGIDFRNENNPCYIGLAKNNRGYRELNDFLSRHLHAKRSFPEEAPVLENCYFIYPFPQVQKQQKKNFAADEFIGISINDLNQVKFSIYREYTEKLIFQQPVTVRHQKDYNAHRLLRAIDLNTLLSKLPKTEQAKCTDRMYVWSEIKDQFEDWEVILKNTQKLAESCAVNFEVDPGINKNLQVYTNSKSEDARLLRKLCKERLRKRYPNPNRLTLKRVSKELNAIIDLDFVSYFLINLDIIAYAKSKNYPFIGRGSGANSVVAFILGITNVDPIELDLYFERFINANRSSPPDFDIDFSWKDRDEITQYIFKRYKNTALMGTYVTFKRRAVMREIGKVFGLPKINIDKLASGHFGIDQLDKLEKPILKYSKYIEGFPNYRSVHSGGIVILNESVHNFAATFLPPKGFSTLQIDMHIAEAVGIHKFDILAQRGLPKITDAIELIKENQPEAELKTIEEIDQFKIDPKINALLKNGDCMGVFYVESPAMRGLLIKLQTDNYLSLVAASSIIRPGVSNGGMKEEYIKRHRYPEKRKEAHPVLAAIMPDTYGVMVYQEDVMKVAHYFAGLELDHADVLRRGMSGKKTAKGQMEHIEQKFRRNCKERGYEQSLIDEVWTQIASFAGYAFPKGHSASYAVESYQSLYLKCYFPLEFMVAVINNGGGFYKVETYLQEIRNCGGILHAPEINKSSYPTTIEGRNIYLGLGYLRELETKTIRCILENRNFVGKFTSLEDFLDRVRISIEQVGILIRVGAFRFTEKNKYELLWEAHFILRKSLVESGQERLFICSSKEFELPKFSFSYLSEAYDQLHLLGFHLFHPFRLLQEKITSKLTAEELKEHCGETVTIYGNLITLKKVKTKNRKWMYFGAFHDYRFRVFDTVHLPKVAQNYPVYGKGIYKCTGVVILEFGYVSLQLRSIYKIGILPNPMS